MIELDPLPVFCLLHRHRVRVADVMVGAHKYRMGRIIQELLDRGQFRGRRQLARLWSVKADDDQSVYLRQPFRIQQYGAGLPATLHDAHRVSRPGLYQLRKASEVREEYQFEKSIDALIVTLRVRQSLIARPEQPAHLKQSRKSIVQDAQRSGGLGLAIPREVHCDAPTHGVRDLVSPGPISAASASVDPWRPCCDSDLP